ncbi:hypothetical protein NQZ68_023702 [Dissostichus eleginoides]|nr:hypothetical protein NQZ68_023702 [Dissostichus eleginoides]
MAAASVTKKIVKFGFKDYVVDDANKKRTAICRVCSIKISDTTTTTSNFIRHYKNPTEKGLTPTSAILCFNFYRLSEERAAFASDSLHAVRSPGHVTDPSSPTPLRLNSHICRQPSSLKNAY